MSVEQRGFSRARGWTGDGRPQWGRRAFSLRGRRGRAAGQAAGLVYSRFNNPNLEVLEDRLGLWEGGESAAVFSSGMSAISTTLWAYLKPGDVLLMSEPLYGGTETLIDKTMPAFGIGAVRVADAVNREAVMAGAKAAVEKARAKGGGRPADDVGHEATQIAAE